MPTLHPTLSADQLIEIIRQRIEDGRLPCVRPDTIYAGYGSGEPCDGCDDRIESTKIVYDVPFPAASRSLKLHFPCYVIWQQQCTSQPASSSATTA
jgi:hypothetical protein